MDTKSIKEILLHNIPEDICDEGFHKVETMELPELVRYYTFQADWCLKHDFPDYATLVKAFGDVEDYGVFVNRSFVWRSFGNIPVLVFHHCSGKINIEFDVDTAIIPILYFANGCNMEVTCSFKTHTLPLKIPVYIYGRNTINVENTESAIFKITQV